MTALYPEKILDQPHLQVNNPAKTKLKKIAIFLPLAYRGGSLKGAKNIAKMIHLGSRQNHEPIDVVFSCLEGHYDIREAFADLLELGITVRETNWRKTSKSELQFIRNFRNIPKELYSEEFALPTDSMNNFSDCDHWLLISDRAFLPLAPIIPYGVVIYDYIQRYIPEKLGSASDASCITTIRNASFVITTTPFTQNDAIQYAGVSPEKICLFPMEFNPPSLFSSTEASVKKDYFLWTTNTLPHKNHVRALKALEHYFKEEQGKLEAVIVGSNTHHFRSPASESSVYVKEIAGLLEQNPFFKKRVHIRGEVTDSEYAQLLHHAKFLWHPGLIDNGTYTVVEAAYLKVPSLSSNYPAMLFMNDRFQLNLLFSDPYNVKDMAAKLKILENTLSSRRTLLPNSEFLDRFTIPHLALDFWRKLRQLF